MESRQVCVIRVDSRSFLKIGNEFIELSDYTIKSSTDGSTELSLVIRGTTSVFETSTSLEVPKR